MIYFCWNFPIYFMEIKIPNSNSSMQIPTDLAYIKQHVFDPFGYEVKNLVVNAESRDNSACTFELEGLKIIYRNAKTTPTKIGQFVTIWKRDKHGITQPYDVDDDFDIIIVNATADNRSGQFVFPKSVLLERGVISGLRNGKRGIRVYPVWDVVESKMAAASQKWQLEFFFEPSLTHRVDLKR